MRENKSIRDIGCRIHFTLPNTGLLNCITTFSPAVHEEDQRLTRTSSTQLHTRRTYSIVKITRSTSKDLSLNTPQLSANWQTSSTEVSCRACQRKEKSVSTARYVLVSFADLLAAFPPVLAAISPAMALGVRDLRKQRHELSCMARVPGLQVVEGVNDGYHQA